MACKHSSFGTSAAYVVWLVEARCRFGFVAGLEDDATYCSCCKTLHFTFQLFLLPFFGLICIGLGLGLLGTWNGSAKQKRIKWLNWIKKEMGLHG